MSIKTFCDVCGEEIEHDAMLVPMEVDKTFRRLGKPIKVRAQVRVVEVQTDAENLCYVCLYRVLDAGDPRAAVSTADFLTANLELPDLSDDTSPTEGTA